MHLRTKTAAFTALASAGMLLAAGIEPIGAALTTSVTTIDGVETTVTMTTTDTPTTTNTPTTTDAPTTTEAPPATTDAPPPPPPTEAPPPPPPPTSTEAPPPTTTVVPPPPQPPPTTQDPQPPIGPTVAPNPDPAPDGEGLDPNFTPLPTDLEAPAEIPLGHLVSARLMRQTTAAAQLTGVPWTLLAGIAEVESGFGAREGRVIGARLGTDAWDAFATDGDGDGSVNGESTADSLATVGAFLVAHRATGYATWDHPGKRGWDAAVGAYFGGEDTLRADARRAAAWSWAIGTTGITRGVRAAKPALVARILRSGRISFESCHRDDIASGQIDPRVLASVLYLRYLYRSVQVSSVKCDHPLHTTTGTISAHSYGRAVDVAAVGSVAILGNQGAGTITEDAVASLLALPTSGAPRQIITLMDLDGETGNSGSFALSDHDDHIHIGFSRRLGAGLRGPCSIFAHPGWARWSAARARSVSGDGARAGRPTRSAPRSR